MYNNTTCEPQKEITLGQIIKDNHEALLEIEDMINKIGCIIFIDTLKKFGGEGVERFKEVFNGLFPTSKDDVKASDPRDPYGMAVVLADDVTTGKRIIEKLNYIINRLV